MTTVEEKRIEDLIVDSSKVKPNASVIYTYKLYGNYEKTNKFSNKLLIKRLIDTTKAKTHTEACFASFLQTQRSERKDGVLCYKMISNLNDEIVSQWVDELLNFGKTKDMVSLDKDEKKYIFTIKIDKTIPLNYYYTILCLLRAAAEFPLYTINAIALIKEKGLTLSEATMFVSYTNLGINNVGHHFTKAAYNLSAKKNLSNSKINILEIYTFNKLLNLDKEFFELVFKSNNPYRLNLFDTSTMCFGARIPEKIKDITSKEYRELYNLSIEDIKKHIEIVKKKEIAKDYVVNNVGKYKSTVNDDGELHSYNDLPSVVWENGAKQWHNFGNFHRENDLPAVISVDGRQQWYKNNLLHRENNLPAVVCANGYKEYWENGKRVKVKKI